MLKGPIQILIDANIDSIGEKVYPVVAPQGTALPYITLIQTGKVKTGKGACAWDCNFDVKSHAINYDDAEAIDLAVVSAFDELNPETVKNVPIHFINHQNTRDEFIAVPNAQYLKVSSFEALLNEENG